MANLQKLIDLDGLSYFLGQIKAKFVRSVNGAKPDSKGNVNIANMEGSTSNAAGKAGLVPIPATGKQDMALCGDATYKVLPIAGGGTGQTTVAGVRYALGLGNTDGALPIANGGTGADNAATARTNLGIDNLDLTPVGDVVFRPFLKKGYVKANGATVNRADYPTLVAFATENNLWTDTPSTEPWKYGRGNGSTTMVLPDYRNRFIQGGDSSSVKSAGLPNITYKLTPEETGESQTGVFTESAFTKGSLFENGAMKMQKTRGAVTSGGGWFEVASLDFDASRCSPIYGSANTVQPPSIQLIPQLRY